MLRRLASLAAIVGVATAPFACGDLGEPAFEGDDGSIVAPATTTKTPSPSDAADETAVDLVSLRGRVVGPAGAALVAIELGGINRIPPGASAPHGGIQPTLEADPFYAYGAISQPDSGIFSVGVPSERLGVHVYARGFYCGLPDAGPVEPEDGTVTILPLPLAAPDGGTLPQEPSISGFSAVPDVVFPGETITIEANVEAAAPELDPLSAQVVAIEPISGWAGVLAPPTPGTWGKGYPNGVYSRLVYAPNVPGEYVYYLVAATQACVVSKPASVRILVSETGEGGIEADGTPAD